MLSLEYSCRWSTLEWTVLIRYSKLLLAVQCEQFIQNFINSPKFPMKVKLFGFKGDSNESLNLPLEFQWECFTSWDRLSGFFLIAFLLSDSCFGLTHFSVLPVIFTSGVVFGVTPLRSWSRWNKNCNIYNCCSREKENHIYHKYLDRQAGQSCVDLEQMQNVASDQGLHCFPLSQHILDTDSKIN